MVVWSTVSRSLVPVGGQLFKNLQITGPSKLSQNGKQ